MLYCCVVLLCDCKNYNLELNFESFGVFNAVSSTGTSSLVVLARFSGVTVCCVIRYVCRCVTYFASWWNAFSRKNDPLWGITATSD